MNIPCFYLKKTSELLSSKHWLSTWTASNYATQIILSLFKQQVVAISVLLCLSELSTIVNCLYETMP